MAVVIETTLGDITVDLFLDQRPVTCLNFLKLCKMKYYNYNLFHSIRGGFIAQTGDPTGEGTGGESIWGILEGPQKRFFSGEKMPKIRHTDAGLLSMVCTNDMMVGSQFFITLAPDLDSLDGTHCVIGEVAEGHEVLRKLNEVICDESNRPYRDVRITHTIVLEDPFNDPPGLRAPSRSPSPSVERLKGGRIAPDEEIDETQGKSIAEVQEMIEEKEAKARATILEIVGDLPDADIAPPENVLFVCKLNPVTTDDDLEIIFSRFGKIVSCEVIRDKKSGNSLQYAFIEFENKKSCEDAYFKMDNVLIDDRRIHVDFSQSVSKMRWLGKGRGVQYFNEEEIKKSDLKNTNRISKNINTSKRHDKEHNEESKERQYYRESKDYNRKSNLERNRDDVDIINRNMKGKNNGESECGRDGSIDGRKYNKDRNYRERESRRSRHSDNQERKHKYERDRDNRDDRSNSNKKQRTSSQSGGNRNNSNNKQQRTRSRSGSNSREKIKNGSSKSDSYEHKRINRNNHSSSDNNSCVKDRNNMSNDCLNRSNDFKSVKNINKKKNDRLSSDNENKPKHVKEKCYENSDKNKKVKKPTHESKSKTPTSIDNKIKKKSNDLKKKDKIKKNAKRKRKVSSSSSDSDSSTSSSSSSSSSESDSESDQKQKKIRRKRKRKSSTSSSSSSDSSSSSSSDSSSDSSSSSSESEPSKKKSKKTVTNKSKKSRKK